MGDDGSRNVLEDNVEERGKVPAGWCRIGRSETDAAGTVEHAEVQMVLVRSEREE